MSSALPSRDRSVAPLLSRGAPIGRYLVLDLVGPEATSTAALARTIARVDPRGAFVVRHGAVAHADLHLRFAAADVNVFASSCENLPIILLEGMAAGLPTACSDRAPMPEVLGEGGEYFDPEDPASIAAALGRLVASPGLRAERARVAYERARPYSWRLCADETFAFLARVCEGKGAP